jgi:IS6 family transposase
MDSSQGMLTVRSSTKVQVAQKRRKESASPGRTAPPFHPENLALLQIVGGDKLIILLLMELHMNPFKGRHFQRDIILWAVRWYCKYGISYRELQEMLLNAE